ncbi:hypothetical protein AMTRI_Chr01g135080 [Amborella trichopoda]
MATITPLIPCCFPGLWGNYKFCYSKSQLDFIFECSGTPTDILRQLHCSMGNITEPWKYLGVPIDLSESFPQKRMVDPTEDQTKKNRQLGQLMVELYWSSSPHKTCQA